VFSSPRDRRKALSGGFRFPAARHGRSPPPDGTPPSPPSLGRVSRWRSSIPGPIPTSTFVPVQVSLQPECPGNLVHRWVWLFPHEGATARSFPQTENALHPSRIALVATRSGFHSVMAAMQFQLTSLGNQSASSPGWSPDGTRHRKFANCLSSALLLGVPVQSIQ
jgi:hypothetical protein